MISSLETHKYFLNYKYWWIFRKED